MTMNKVFWKVQNIENRYKIIKNYLYNHLQFKEGIMQTIKIIIITLLVLVFILSCKEQPTDLDTDPEPIGKMALQIDMTNAPAEVVKIVGTLSRNGYEDRNFQFDIEGETATALVENLAPGVWNLKVDAYNDSDIIIYTGSTNVYVVSGSVTPVHLQLNPATGSIYITVDWGDSGREWGEPGYGIRISINLDDKELKPYDKAYSNILIENVSGDSMSYEAYVGFCLYDNSGIIRYEAFFNLTGDDSSDYFHPKSLISFKENDLINRTVEITHIPWVSPISSKPPETDFYNLIQSGQYNLQLQIEPILPVLSPLPIQPVLSNQVIVNIKSAESEKVIYYNSFETAADTAGFSGYGYYDFKAEPSPDGGNYSLYVSGGCIWPHVSIEIPAQGTDGYYQLAGWGRNLEIGGLVELHNNLRIPNESIYFNVTDSAWTHYAADSILYCPAGQSMTLMMGAGGIVASSMLVDQIEIVKVK